MKRKISAYDITIPEFKTLIVIKQYQRYITLEECKIWFDEMLTFLHGEIILLIFLIIAYQVEGVNSVAVLIGANDNHIRFVNSDNSHRLQIE